MYFLLLLAFTALSCSKIPQEINENIDTHSINSLVSEDLPKFEGPKELGRKTWSYFRTQDPVALEIIERMEKGFSLVSDWISEDFYYIVEDFNPYTFESSYGMCGTYTYLLLKLQGTARGTNPKTGLDFEHGHSGDGHVHLKVTLDGNLKKNIIVDPSIRQFVDHPAIGDIFIGTQEELIQFLEKHPESIAGGLEYYSDLKNILWQLWGIK